MAATSSSESSAKSTFNILLLGHTVHGKETFANALLNYLKIHDFDYAKSNDLYHITPSQLTFPNDVDYPLVIEPSDGSQVPMCYPIELFSRSMCLIDPPGMDYAENSELNVHNFDNTINYFGHHLVAIHAVCVLINSKETVKSTSFRAYLHQLFSRLPQNAHKNVFFCFPCSQNDSCDTLLDKILQKDFFNEMESSDNYFHIDTKAYRFVWGKKSWLVSKWQESTQRKNWISSGHEALAMLSKVVNASAFYFVPTDFELHCDTVEVTNVNEVLPSQVLIEEGETSKKISVAFEQNEKEIIVTDVPMADEEEDTSSLPEYNILLLGEKGAGKSTTINAFANYAQYSSFDEAAANEFVQLIPSQFMLPNPVIDEPMVLKSGDHDANERLAERNSSTKDPMSYLFRFGGGTIRIIDTPSMGDTAGAEVDKQNFEKILHYLHCFEKLHGICILMKANETRRIASFRYCINQLLTYLHKSACKNIVFCFTFSRNSCYGPGEGFSTLRRFLAKELAEVELVLKTGINCYFVDNEAYRFLVAKKIGYPFRQQQENSYRESWDMSAEQTNRMMQYILNLEPHSLVETSNDDAHQLMPKEKVIFKMNKSITSKPPPKVPEFNILLLGETGAGKSTTINAFANYLKYSTFEEATENDFVEMIPSKFTFPHPVSGEPFEIISGIDKNKLQGDGNSSTQDPVCYQFRFGGGLIRLIDTPGMGDTTGVDADKFNFDKILAHLNHYDTLHGICILMKSTETRKTASFRYCINELLTHLHKSACQNIVFCFTYSRNSFYGPGEGFSTLRGFLQKELKEVNLNLKSGDNCFYIDNEAYRFLVAKKINYPFKPKQELSYKESWETSVQQTEEMMDRIMKSSPHKLNETCSLNNARKLILELAEPMVKLQVNINANMERFKEERKRIMASSEIRDELACVVRIEAGDIEMRHLSNPVTVCTANKCIEVIQAGEKSEINYKTRCHEDCILKNVETNEIGHPSIKNCQAMNCGQSENCIKCGCHWQKHMHQTFEYVRVKRTIVGVVKKGELENTENWILQRREASAVVRQTLKEYQEEFEIIQDMCAKFAYILANNSNTAHCRFIGPYLDLLIDEEKQKVTFVPNYPRLTYNTLVTMKETHEKKVLELTNAIANQTHPEVTIEHIDEYREQLLQLKHSGPLIRQMLKIRESKRDNKLN